MSTSTLSIERRPDGVFSAIEQQALIGFLGGYSGFTREAYALDLRQFAAWCQQRQLALFDVARHDIESFARQLEDIGRARATIARRWCTITALYRYAVEEGLLDDHQQCMSADRAWTTSPTPPDWTATRSERCSSRPGSRGPRARADLAATH